MIHKAWCSIEDVPYYFSRSYIKFQGHTGWQIDNLDQIRARLLGRSQLSNPSDLPCSEFALWALGKWLHCCQLDSYVIALVPMKQHRRICQKFRNKNDIVIVSHLGHEYSFYHCEKLLLIVVCKPSLTTWDDFRSNSMKMLFHMELDNDDRYTRMQHYRDVTLSSGSYRAFRVCVCVWKCGESQHLLTV